MTLNIRDDWRSNINALKIPSIFRSYQRILVVG